MRQCVGLVMVLTAGCFDLEPSHYLFVKTDAGVTTGAECARVCAAPPTSRCAGESTLESFASRGVCSANGGCSYAPVQVHCDSGCSDGGCVDAPCVGLFCDRPPASSCDDATHLRIFDERTGVCALGGCTYQPTVVDCPNGCADGQCKGNLCAGKSCLAPPPSVCLNEASVRRFVIPGTCAAGLCKYLAVDSSCANGCVDGVCTADLCSAVTCVQPPTDTCIDSKTRHVFETSGRCESGHCLYAPAVVACAASEWCNGGRCVPISACNVTSCASGCCEGNDCVAAGDQNDARCGTGASLCGSCGVGSACQNGTCRSK